MQFRNGLANKMRLIERIVLFNPVRVYLQRKYEAPRVLAFLPCLELSTCLEIGCGHGAGALLITHYTGCNCLKAIDNNPEIIKKARRKLSRPPRWAKNIPLKGIHFQQKDASKMKFKDESFEAVFHFHFLSHNIRWEVVIAEVYRVLKPNGVYSFEELLIPDSPLFFNDFFGHVPITVTKLQEAFIRTGFKIEQFECGKWSKLCFVTVRKKV